MIRFSGGRILSLLLMCLVVLVPTSAFAAQGSPTYQHTQELDHKLQGFPPADGPTVDCLWFTETAGQRGGFSVCDDYRAQFRTAFEHYGLENVGYPVSTRFVRDGFVTQAFQKAIFQWREESQEVVFVNVFDELHDLGFDERLLETYQTPKQLPADWDGQLNFEQVVQKRQALLSRPALREAYFAVSDPMTFFGLPTSEVQDMGNLYAIRLQRAVLQEWKVDVPWAKAGQVTVANGGDIAKELVHVYISPASTRPEPRPPHMVDMPPQEPEAPTLLEEARATYEAGEYAEAILLFEAFLEQQKEGDWAVEAHSTLAVSHCHVGEYEKAIDGALEVLAISPNSAWGDDAQATITASFYYQNEYAQSFHAWIQLRHNYPDSDWADEDALPELWRTYCTSLVENQRGIFFASSGEEGVIEQLEQHFATLTADSEPPALFKQGMALYKSEQYVEAVSLWQALIDQNPLDKWSVAARYVILDVFNQLNAFIVKDECLAVLVIGGDQEALRQLEELATCYREMGYLVGEANVLQELAMVFYQAGNNEQALVTYQRALELQQAIGNTIRAGNILHDLGLVYEREGQYSQAQASYEQAIETLNKTPNVWRTEAQIGIAYTLNKMGALQEAQGQYDEALTNYQQSQAIWSDLNYETDIAQLWGDLNYETDIAQLWLNIGAVYQAQGRHINALNAYKQAFEIYKNSTRAQFPDVLSKVQNALGLGYHALGQYEEAISAYQSALESEEQAKLFNHLGLTYHKLGRYQDALASYQQALDLSEREDDIFGQSLTYHNIGLVHHTLGDDSKALDNYQQALDLWHTTSGRDVELSSILRVPFFTGLVYDNYGRHAFVTLSAEGSLNTRVLSMARAGEANTLTSLAALYVAQGDLTKAKATYEEVLHIQQESGDQIGVGLTQQAIAELP